MCSSCSGACAAGSPSACSAWSSLCLSRSWSGGSRRASNHFSAWQVAETLRHSVDALARTAAKKRWDTSSDRFYSKWEVWKAKLSDTNYFTGVRDVEALQESGAGTFYLDTCQGKSHPTKRSNAGATEEVQCERSSVSRCFPSTERTRRISQL